MAFVNVKNLKEAPIAMTDLETSGDVFGVHEILEIGLVVFDQNTFEILDTLNLKTKPQNIGNAVPAALERNGYNEKDWQEAVPLKEAVNNMQKKPKERYFAPTTPHLIGAL